MSGVKDHDLPLSVNVLRKVLGNPRDVKQFFEAQYMATLKDLTADFRKYDAHELIPTRTIRSLGQGSYAHVYRVELVLQKREVAHKMFMRSTTAGSGREDSFNTEMRSLRKLGGHRHIVEYLGAYQTPRSFGILLSPVATCGLSMFLRHSDDHDLPDRQGIL